MGKFIVPDLHPSAHICWRGKITQQCQKVLYITLTTWAKLRLTTNS